MYGEVKVKTIVINGFEEINNLAEDVIVGLRFSRYQYDAEGKDGLCNLSADEVQAKIMYQVKNAEFDYLNFAENKELRSLSLFSAVYMPLQEIKEKYLYDILPMARGIMRNDPRLEHGVVVSDEVPDEVLDNFLALRWKENLKLWLVQMQKSNNAYMENTEGIT